MSSRRHGEGKKQYINPELKELELQLPREVFNLLERIAEEQRPAIFAAVERQFRSSLAETPASVRDSGDKYHDGSKHVRRSYETVDFNMEEREASDDEVSCSTSSGEASSGKFGKLDPRTAVPVLSGCSGARSNSKVESEAEQRIVSNSCSSAKLDKQRDNDVVSKAPNNGETVQGKVVSRSDLPATLRNRVIRNSGHTTCTRDCIRETETRDILAKLRKENPLCVPLRLGWLREVQAPAGSASGDCDKSVFYVAPCGRMLRNAVELDRCLCESKSRLELDLFSFDALIDPLRVFKPSRPLYFCDDFSRGKESTPISVVNSLQNGPPPAIEYVTKSVATNDVLAPGGLSLDKGFLAGCDCKDNCRNQSECSCQKYAMSNACGVDGLLDANAVYQYKRLYKCVTSGLFECNANCKCDRRCSNRVVQNGVRLRLQLFRTQCKGWGVRCLDDVPQGAFVCTYVGELLRDEAANVRGLDYGDEYLSNLDLIELVESEKAAKVGFQRSVSLADCNLLQVLNQSSSTDDDDEDDNDPDWSACVESRQKHASKKVTVAKARAKSNVTRLVVECDDSLVTPLRPACPPRNDTVLSVARRTSGLCLRRKMFGEEEPFVTDTRQFGSVARFLNHSCSPNLFVQNVFVDTHDVRFPVMAFFAVRRISAGSELCWDYNYALGQLPGREVSCLCGAENCRGRLL